MKGLYYQKILNHAKAADSELLYALGVITKDEINRGEKIVENSMTGLLSKSSMQFFSVTGEQGEIFWDMALSGQSIEPPYRFMIRPPYENVFIEFDKPIPIPDSIYSYCPIGSHSIVAIMVADHPTGVIYYEDIPTNKSMCAFLWGKDCQNRYTQQFGNSHPILRAFFSDLEETYPLRFIESSPTNLIIQQLHKLETNLSLWWETENEFAVYCYELWVYLMAYIQSRTMQVIDVQPSRAERRRAKRENEIPAPWHTLQVNPELRRRAVNRSTGTGTAHRYRYDVRGHWRRGRHKRKTGTYSHTIEWVPSHQRGLANDLFIPKSYEVITEEKEA